MKNLLSLMALALVSSSAQASFVSQAYKMNVDAKTRSSIKAAVLDVEYYSAQPESAAGNAIRTKALNVLKASFGKLDQAAQTSLLAQDTLRAASSEVASARAHLNSMIALHNQGTRADHASLTKQAKLVKADFAVLEE